MSNSIKDDKQRRGFVLDMLKEPVGTWVGEEVTNAVSSPDVSKFTTVPAVRVVMRAVMGDDSQQNRVMKSNEGDYWATINFVIPPDQHRRVSLVPSAAVAT